MTPSVCASLQIHCINSIAAEFDRFCIAYSSPDSNIPKRHFEFLQRKYTKDLLTTLKSTKSLRNEHLDFMINRYTKEFDLYQFDGCDWENIEEKLVNVGDVIVDLKLSSNAELNSQREKSYSLEKIIDDLNWKYFPNLETLDLSGSRFCDETLINIGRYCRLLKELNVSDCAKLTNKGFVVLFHSEGEINTRSYLHLQTLNVLNTRVDDDGILCILENISGLEILRYEKIPKVLYKMHKKDLDNNCLSGVRKYNLTFLCFHDIYKSLTDVLLVCSILCPRVKNLTIHNLSEYNLKICSEFSQLDSVTFSGIENVPPYMFSINSFLEDRGTHLSCIHLDDFSISISVLAKNCPKLKELNLNCTFETADEWDISPLKFLRSFSLYGANFSDENTLKSTISVLSASPKLEVLSLCCCHFCDQNKNEDLLKSMTALKKFDMEHCDIEVSFVKQILLSCSELQDLVIESCENISIEQYHHLLKLIREMKSTVELTWDEGSDISDSDDDDDSAYDKSESSDDELDIRNEELHVLRAFFPVDEKL